MDPDQRLKSRAARWLRRLQGRPAATQPAMPSRQAEAEAGASTAADVEAERQRIYRDLHDDIGARLLSIVHSTTEPQVQELARQALRDLREVVYHARAEPGPMAHILGEMRLELAERLEQAGWTLEWDDGDLPDRVLPGERALHLYRIVREAATNALKHGISRRMRVRTRHVDGTMIIEIADLGERWHADETVGQAGAPGSGMVGMQARAARLGGALELKDGTLQGSKVLLRFPLDLPQDR